jgi:SAM-dependent methyltransferase
MSPVNPPICDYDGSDYQERFWDHGGREYEDQAEALALRRLVPRGEGLLLEVGAGAGRHSPRYGSFDRVVLLDYSRTQLQQAQSRLGRSGRYRYVVADVYRLPFAAETFGAATMIRTLHHMADPLLALQQVRRVLGIKASLVLEFANKRNLKAIARWIARRQPWSPFDRAPVEFARLNFDFHPDAVRSWLLSAGFRVRRTLTVSHFRLPLLKRIIPLRVLVWLDGLAQFTGGLWQLSPSVFVLADAAEMPSRGFHRRPRHPHPGQVARGDSRDTF